MMDKMPQGKQTVTDEELLEWMRKSADPAFTTKEVAEAFDMTTEGIRGRLNELEDGRRLYKKKPTSRTVIWWADTNHDSSRLSA